MDLLFRQAAGSCRRRLRMIFNTATPPAGPVFMEAGHSRTLSYSGGCFLCLPAMDTMHAAFTLDT
jgi:hypothetical protein